MFTPRLGWRVIAFVFMISQTVQAIDAITFTGVTGGYSDGFDRVVGWEFTTGARPISVDQLGAYDHGGNGLATPHSVGIYALADQSLRAMAFIPAGTAAPLSGFFRYAPIVPTILAPNTQYVVAATWPQNSDLLVWSPANGTPPTNIVGLTVDAAITLGHTIVGTTASARYDNASVLEFPNTRVAAAFPGDPRILFAGPSFSFFALPQRRDSGDYNDDGVVDAADYLVWRDTLGLTANLSADGDLDGDVDEADYNRWRANFGRTVSAVGPTTSILVAIPEPSGFYGAVVACIGFLWHRPRAAKLRFGAKSPEKH